MGDNPFPGKDYVINGENRHLRPLSFFEVVDLPDLFIGVLESMPEDAEISGAMIARHAKEPVKELMARCLDISTDELGALRADEGMEILADFLELNLNENFCEAFRRIRK